MPFVGLLWAMASDRSRRVDEAHERLRALQHERRRVQAAWQRVGDAFASNLDLGALLEIVTRAASEALDGEAGQASAVRDGRATATLLSEVPSATQALGLAQETALVRGDAVAAVQEGAVHAIAGVVGGSSEPGGMVSIARGRPFSPDEHAVLAHLCEQAGVSAANAVRHERLQETRRACATRCSTTRSPAWPTGRCSATASTTPCAAARRRSARWCSSWTSTASSSSTTRWATTPATSC